MATTTRSQQRPTSPPKRPRSRFGLLLGVVVLAIALVIAVVVLTDDKESPPTPKEPKAAPLPDGLEAGDASATFDLATREVGGVPRGFPQTVAGVVEASAAALGINRTAGFELPPSDRAEVQAEFGYLEYSNIDALTAEAQAREGLNGSGQPVNARPGDRYYNDCLPQYGMYQALPGNSREVESAEPLGAAPTDVWVLIWAPCIEGIGSPDHIDDLRVKWDVYANRWAWRDGDWQAVEDKWEWPDEQVPTPKDLLRPNVSIAERNELFEGSKHGWRLFKGYSEEWPTDLLGKGPTR